MHISYRKIFCTLAIALAVLMTATVTVGVVLYNRAHAILDDPTQVLSQELPTSTSPDAQLSAAQLVSEASQTNTTDEYILNPNIFNLVLLGIDSDNDREANDMGYRSDTMVVCAIDVQNQTIQAVTIPRDTKATMNLLKDDGSGEFDRLYTYRINSAFEFAFCGRADLAYQNTMDAIEVLFATTGLEVDLEYYLGIDMDGIGPLATAVGGVPVTLDATIPDVGQAGESLLLKGDVAKLYVRTRKGEGLTGSDVDRANRQQLFFLGLARQIKNMGVMAMPGLYSTVSAFMDTNLTLDQILALAGLLGDMDIEQDVTFRTLAGDYVQENGQDLYIADEDAMAQLIQDTWYIQNPNYAG